LRTIAITNQKGGSGKTTTAVNLAASLGEKRKKVLIVDLDPQASASKWLGVRDDGRGLLDALTEDTSIEALIQETAIPGVSLIPSGPLMIRVEKSLAGEPGAEIIFREALARIPAKRYDLILLDCPPSFGLLGISALVAAREVLVPVEASSMAVEALGELTHTLKTIQKRLNPNLDLSSILACRVDSRTNLSKEIVGTLRQHFGKKVFKTVVRETVRLREAPSHHEPITIYAPRSAAAEDYRSVAAELLRRKRRN